MFHTCLLAALWSNNLKWSFQDLITGFSPIWIAVHVVGGLIAFQLIARFAEAKGFDTILFSQTLSALGPTGIPFLLYILIVNPALEELFWRKLQSNPGRSVNIEDIAFGLFHILILILFLPFNYSLAFALGLTAIAWLWRQLRFRYAGLGTVWLAHLGGDVLFVALVVSMNQSIS